MDLNTQQLAEILIGVARAQQAIIDAMESAKPGFKGTYLGPALDGVAKTRSMGRTPALQDLPARLLLQCQARGGPNVEQIARDLEALLSGLTAAPGGGATVAARAVSAAPRPAASASPATAAPAVAAATSAASTPGTDNDLDMTKL